MEKTNRMPLLRNSALRLAIMFQPVHNILNSVEAVEVWKKHHLAEWYKKKVVGHQRHAFESVYLEFTSEGSPSLSKLP